LNFLELGSKKDEAAEKLELHQLATAPKDERDFYLRRLLGDSWSNADQNCRDTIVNRLDRHLRAFALPRTVVGSCSYCTNKISFKQRKSMDIATQEKWKKDHERDKHLYCQLCPARIYFETEDAHFEHMEQHHRGTDASV
jgi:hypothetical protein